MKAKSSCRFSPQHSDFRNGFLQSGAIAKMPSIMYGTAWKKEKTCDLVIAAIRAGFRGIDTACQPKHYFEPGVGQALQRLAAEDGIKREDIFLQTKFTPLRGQDPKNVPYDTSAPLATQVQQSLAASLRNLQTTYIDSLVLHSPLDTHQNTMVVWREFEKFVKQVNRSCKQAYFDPVL
jgi:diketogulonate reductase-like aldo/keto reductase